MPSSAVLEELFEGRSLRLVVPGVSTRAFDREEEDVERDRVERERGVREAVDVE